MVAPERRLLLVFTCGVLSILAYYSGILDSATRTLAARRRLSLESALFSDGFASSSLVLEEHTLMSASPLLLRSRAATATTTTAGEGTAGSSSISSAVACADVLRADRAATEGDAQSRLFDAVFAADDPSEVRRRSWKRGNVQRPGGAPSVWPAPRSTRRGGRHVRHWRAAELAPTAFRFVPRFEAAAAAQSPTLRAVLRRAHERYCRLIFGDGALKHGATAAAQSSSSTAQLAALHVVINASSSAWPRLNMSEAYSLRVDGAEATLRARTVYGALRGLETFAQLVIERHEWVDRSARQQRRTMQRRWSIAGPLPLVIDDAPRWPWRGVLIDTARHFMPLSVILPMLDAMAYNKLNVLHWHICDAQSFPLLLPGQPRLAMSGAFTSTSGSGSAQRRPLVYTSNDVSAIVRYARDRGIRVVPELDVPAHTASWGRAFPKMLANCTAVGSWSDMKLLDKFALDPTAPETRRIVKDVLKGVAALFPDEYIHLGGDEVDVKCWTSLPELMARDAAKTEEGGDKLGGVAKVLAWVKSHHGGSAQEPPQFALDTTTCSATGPAFVTEVGVDLKGHDMDGAFGTAAASAAACCALCADRELCGGWTFTDAECWLKSGPLSTIKRDAVHASSFTSGVRADVTSLSPTPPRPAAAFTGAPLKCAGWKQTGGCSADGPRESDKDAGCDFAPTGWASGYCECTSNNATRVGLAAAGATAAPSPAATPASVHTAGEILALLSSSATENEAEEKEDTKLWSGVDEAAAAAAKEKEGAQRRRRRRLQTTRRAEVGCKHGVGWTCADACAASKVAIDAGVMVGGAQRGGNPASSRSSVAGSAAASAAPAVKRGVVQMFSEFVRWAVDEVDALGRRSAVWQGAIDGGDAAAPLPASTLVEPWKCWGGAARQTIQAAFASGRSVVNPTCMYLDWTDSWEKYYLHSPDEDVPSSFSDEVVSSLLLGGEGCLWSENIASTNLLCRAWPRTSAVAERLWSSLERAPRSNEGVASASPRLEQQWRRMVSRGIAAAPFSMRTAEGVSSKDGDDRGYTGTTFEGTASWRGQCPLVHQETHRDLRSRRLDARIAAIVEASSPNDDDAQKVAKGSRSALGVAGLTLHNAGGGGGHTELANNVSKWLRSLPQLDMVAICDADGWNAPGKKQGTRYFASEAGFAFSYLHSVGGDNRCARLYIVVEKKERWSHFSLSLFSPPPSFSQG